MIMVITKKIKEKALALQQKMAQEKAKLQFIRYLHNGNGRKFYIMGTPQYTNLGDSAIDLVQKKILEQIGAKEECIKEITKEEYRMYRDTIRRCIGERDVITCIGGGNMGDEWLAEEQFRRMVLQDFTEHTIVVFPQTMYYTSTEQGKQEQKRSVPFYNHENRVLVARDRLSCEQMKDLYPEATVLLTPDTVLWATAKMFGVGAQPRSGILLLIRKDRESALTDAQKEALRTNIRSLGVPVMETDMYAAHPVTKSNRAEQVRQKMQQFAEARLVVTDRLHGMVFAALTGTPCVVFNNYNHKVEGTYAWLKGLPYIQLVSDAQETDQKIREMLQQNEAQPPYVSRNGQFDELLQQLKAL